tara:strand:- start:7210 stop:7425 length:216 start_codon:yes stop_codon:yes gene_type:complete
MLADPLAFPRYSQAVDKPCGDKSRRAVRRGVELTANAAIVKVIRGRGLFNLGTKFEFEVRILAPLAIKDKP